MIGVLLTNLGTPSAPTPRALKKYLAEFLSDPRVVEIPKLLWQLILHAIVLPLRPKKSAKLYQKIWRPEGSPLLINSQRLTEKLQNALPQEYKVVLGMRYGKPSIAEALNELKKHPLTSLIILPLYPQYSSTTTASTFDAVAAVLKTWRVIPEVHFISSYYDNENYISALANSVRSQNIKDYLLFSFHGLPQRFIDKGDPYQEQCFTSARLVAEKLQLPKEKWGVVFQSRFGKAKWIQPYCDVTLKKMPAQGYKNISILCPGFAVDCLETLEEIAIQNRQLFLGADGESFNYIPALNDSNEQVEMLAAILKKII
jgi:ferrochelatase